MTAALPAMTATRRVLICAATRWEAYPLCQSLGLGPSGARLWSGPVKGSLVTLLKTGPGAPAAAAALARIDDREAPPSLVISAGFAGALQPDLDCGDLVAEQLTPCPQAARALESSAVGVGLVPRFGLIQHADEVLCDPDDKLDCGRATGALAVDMESAVVRSWARERSLPALALRVIFDEAACALPRSQPLGESAASLALYVATHPFAWPRLAALWPRQRRAAAALALAMKAFLEAL